MSKRADLIPDEFKEACHSVLLELNKINPGKYRLSQVFMNNQLSMDGFTPIFLDEASPADVSAAI